ncbi:flagellar hook-associated protein FlgL [Granulosicoccaceae sp. 1_MG-2023]|nr:flagellar hook-associated protein FlgL [Granulosicoccaceae sp. 1_MG-2023]
MRISSTYFAEKMSVDYMSRQSELAQIQEQLGSGKQINRPSDDPASVMVIGNLQQTSTQFEQYNRNGDFAEARLEMEETALTSVANVLLRSKELALQANNDTYSESDTSAFVVELKQQLAELVDYANTTDANGDYLFGGNVVDAKPFVGSESIAYKGDSEAKLIQIGSTRSVYSSDSGDDIFMRIPNGNGDLAVSAQTSNTGTGVMAQAEIVDRDAFTGGDLTVSFTSADSFDVIDNTSGSTVISNSAYTSGMDISVAGVQFSITGTPQAGDEFSVEPSSNTDVFTTIQNFINVLENSPANEAESALRQQQMAGVLSDIDQAYEHINVKRSEVGARLNYVSNAREENESIQYQVDSTIAGMEDLDYAEAVTRMETELTALEALQKSYARLEGMSLFSYL